MEKKTNVGTSKLNAYEQRLSEPGSVPVREWRPLSSSWLVEGHRRQDEIASFKAIPRWGK